MATEPHSPTPDEPFPAQAEGSAAGQKTTANPVCRRSSSHAATLLGTGLGEEASQLPRLSIPGYELLEELGRGGMGVVYLAWQSKLSRVVAVKMILGGGLVNEHTLRRFLAEAESVASLQHPGIVQVYESGECEGAPYFSMQYIRGGSLADRLGSGLLPPRDAAHLIERLARTMAYAHAHGVVHRDLKPENILLQPLQDHIPAQEEKGAISPRSAVPGEPPPSAAPRPDEFRMADYVPKVTDFGLAKRLHDSNHLTAAGTVLGTPSYMAPELAKMQAHDVGPAVDIYALGAILYWLLTGRPPFQGGAPAETMRQVLEQEPQRPTLLIPGIPKDLETICLKCLQKDPVRRYASASELGDDLKRFLNGEPIWARPTNLRERALKWCQRRPLVAGLAGTLLLSLLTLLGGGIWFTFHLDAAYREAEARATAEALAHQDTDAERERAERSLQLTRAQLLTTQLLRVAPLLDRDPGQALELLLNARVCPVKERDFTWGHFYRRARWDRATFRGHSRTITALAFSHDGQLLASGDETGLVKLWSATDGKELEKWQACPGQVVCLAWSPDGQWLAVGGGTVDSAARRWKQAHLRLRQVAKKSTQVNQDWPNTHVRALAWSPDGQVLAVSDHRCQLTLHDMPTLKERKRWQQSALALQFAPNGRALAALNAEGTLSLLDLQTGRSRDQIELPTDPAVTATIAADLSTAALVNSKGLLTLQNLSRRQVVPPVVDGPELLHGSVALSANGSRLLSGQSQYGSTLHLLSREHRELTVLRLPSFQAGGEVVALTPAGTLGASAGAHNGEPGWLTLWEMQPASERVLPKVGRSFLRPIPGGQDWLTGGKGGQELHVLDLETGQTRPVPCEGRGAILNAAWLPGGGLVVGTAGDVNEEDPATPGELVWSTSSKGGPWRVLAQEARGINCVAVSPDGHWVAAGAGDFNSDLNQWQKGRLRLFHLPSGKETLLSAADWPVNAACFSPDGRRLAFSANDGAWLWETGRSPQRLLSRPAGVRGLTFSPDGRWVALADRHLVLLVSAATGQVVEQLEHAWPVVALTFSPDGRNLATSSQVQNGGHWRVAVQLWDVLSRQERARLRGSPAPIVDLAFTADGHTLLGLEQSGDVRLWQARFPGNPLR